PRRVRVNRATRTACALALLAFGLACLGQAGWIHAKAALAQVLVDRAFERALDGDPDARPWPWADTRPVARLRLADGGRSLVVLAGASGRNLAFGPAHDPASVLPGEPGNSLISGHRDTHFRGLARLRPGDRIAIERADGRRLEFIVAALQVVDSRRTRIALDGDVPRLILATCYPFDAVDPGGPLRFVVTAEKTGVRDTFL
ncbi:MAG TPA: class GN sortase, partial [Chiayiivirga sp.]|nr:class GN sortase [Chiayiivirga sp.]